MTKFILLLLSLSSCLMAGPILRISKAYDAQEKGAEAVVNIWTDSDGNRQEEKLWAGKEAVITEADVQWAGFMKGRFRLTISEEAAERLQKVLSESEGASNRIAMFVEGKLICAPRMPLGASRSLSIPRLEESYDEEKMKDLAKRMRGKPAK